MQAVTVSAWKKEEKIMMNYLLQHKTFLSLLLIFNFTFLSVYVSPLYAGMISTARILKADQPNSERERLNSFLERKDVQAQLEAWGLDKKMAAARVDALTDEEVSQIVRRMDQLPAGGDALGVIIGAAVLVFLILLFTDILGYTDVFKFVKKQ